MSTTPSTAKEITEAASRAGELLIRAAAALGTLSREDQMLLDAAAGGGIAHGVSAALTGISKLSDQLVDSLKRHPPAGFIGFIRNPDEAERVESKQALRSAKGDESPRRGPRPR
ncbi:hypothetical protein ABIC83_002526 [Roseateles asaccharophilus]|uniref:hypothetical protein n=1 Tax=Roseateles asaccharophilus TaxID=582607 RepID=UPI0038324FB4